MALQHGSPIIPIFLYVIPKPLFQLNAAQVTRLQLPRAWSHAHLSGTIVLERPDCTKRSQPSPAPAIKFTCFSKLPKELRLNIWSLSLTGNRHVVLEFCQDKKRLVTKTPPVALYTCVESRSEALRKFKRVYDFETPWKKGKRSIIYIDPEFDTVQLPDAVFNPSLAELAGSLGVAFPRYAQYPIHHLALDLDLFYDMYFKKQESLLWMRLCMFSTLREVIIICNLSKRYPGREVHTINLLASLRFASQAKTIKRCSLTYRNLDILPNDQASDLINFVNRIGGDLEAESSCWKAMEPRSTETTRRIDVGLLVKRDF